MTRAAVLALLVALLSWFPQAAAANGLYLTERGTRALARGGAFVAGASGLDAVLHNPAGLSGTGLLAELTLPLASARYRRELAIDDGTGTTRSVYAPTVRGESELIPFPTLVAAISPERARYTVAFGMVTPTFALMGFPSTVRGRPSPARYTLSGFTDSRVALLGAWASYRPNDWLSLGAGVHGLVGTFRSTITFPLSLPDRLLAAPEDPDYDATGRINVGPTVAPSGSAGITLKPTSFLRLALAGELPLWLSSDSTFDVRLPDTSVFDTVQVQGKKAHLSMRLPAVLRAGVEVKPTEALAIEAAYVREFWSLHNAITVEPDDIQITGIPGGPDSLALPRIRIPRGYQDASSYRLGAELTGSVLGFGLAARAGVAYEESAVPPAYLSLASLDFDKVVVSVGSSIELLKRLRGDLTYARVFARGKSVSPDEARLTRINPLSGNAPDEYVNGGRYRFSAHVLSGALVYSLR